MAASQECSGQRFTQEPGYMRPVDYLVRNLQEARRNHEDEVRRAGGVTTVKHIAAYGSTLRGLFAEFGGVYGEYTLRTLSLNGNPNEILVRRGTTVLDRTTGGEAHVDNLTWGEVGEHILGRIINWNNWNGPV